MDIDELLGVFHTPCLDAVDTLSLRSQVGSTA